MSLIGDKAYILGTSRVYSWRESENSASLHNYCNDFTTSLRDIATHPEDQEKVNNVSTGLDAVTRKGAGRAGVIEYVANIEIGNIMIPNIILRSIEDNDIMFATRIEDIMLLVPRPGVNSIYKRTEFEDGTGEMIIEYNFMITDGCADTYGRLNFGLQGNFMRGHSKYYNDIDYLGDYSYIDRFSDMTYYKTNNRFINRYLDIIDTKYEFGTPKGDMQIDCYDDFGDIPIGVIQYIENCYRNCHKAIMSNRYNCHTCGVATNKHNYSKVNYYKDVYYCGSCAVSTERECNFCNNSRFMRHFAGDIFEGDRFTAVKKLLLKTGVTDVCNNCLDHIFLSCNRCNNTSIINLEEALRQGWDYITSAYDELIHDCDRYNGMILCTTCYDTTLGQSIATPVNGFDIIEDIFPFTTNTHNINRYVSVESEIMTYHDFHEDVHPEDEVWAPRNWRVVNDASLNDGGVEFKNIRPVRGDYIEVGLLQLENASKDQDFWVDSSCGIHVHMDARDFKWRELRSLLMIINCVEAPIIQSLPEIRRDSKYCKVIDKDYGSSLGNEHIYKSINNLRELVNFSYRELSNVDPGEDRYNGSRYRGTNIHSRFFHGTIEFRYHEGSISAAPVMSWIHLCNRIMVAAKNLERNDKKWKRIKDMVLRDEHGLDVIKNIGGKSALKYIEDKIKSYE
tara:strand:- start:18853 stop:20883 length:2031 start_codon:yes stop_codon:yes gene_type:complete